MGMHNYGFLLDENVVGLREFFPRNRAKTVYDFGLQGKPDAQVIETAGDQGLIIVTSDAQYPEFFRAIAKRGNPKKRLCGLMMIGPTDIEKQKKLFPIGEIENRLRLNGHNIPWLVVMKYNLLIRVGDKRKIQVERLPPCPCTDSEQLEAVTKFFGPIDLK